MDYILLANELTTDPLVRGYSTMSDADAAVDINSLYRPAPNVIGEMLKYLINKKHRTNQGGDDTYSPIVGRLYHIARSNDGDDPFLRGVAYAGLDIQHIHACQAFVTLFDSQQLSDLDFDDVNLPYGYVEAAGAWANDPHTLALKSLSENQISRALELGLPIIKSDDIAYARSL